DCGDRSAGAADQLDRVALELLGEPSTGPLWPLSVFLSHEDILSSEMSCLRGEVHRQHTEGDINLHVRLCGSPNERLALLFRDWFCAHPEAVPSYARFKQALAQSVVDTGTYA